MRIVGSRASVGSVFVAWNASVAGIPANAHRLTDRKREEPAADGNCRKPKRQAKRTGRGGLRKKVHFGGSGSG